MPSFAHLREIALHLFGRAEIMTFSVRFEGTVSDALQKEFAVAFEEELSDRANTRQRRRSLICHSERTREVEESLTIFLARVEQ